MQSISDQIHGIIDNALSEIPFPDQPATLYDPLRYTLGFGGNGGKRIRPRFVLLSTGLCGGDIKLAVPAALSVELLHNFTLIHDDIMDKATSRRGKPSVHSKWNQSVAILSGDVMFASAFDQLRFYGSDTRYSKQSYFKLNDLFLESVRQVCEGQAMDLDFEERSDVSPDEYLEMIGGKTARLISCSMQMGAIVADAGDDLINNAGIVGMEAGLAFQIQDDLLDATGDPEKFGKKTGGDISEGKKTWLSIIALKKASGSRKKYLLDVLQKKESSQTEIKNVIELYYELGVVDETQAALKTHYLNAISHLDKFPDSLYKDEIKALLNQLMNRDK